MYKLVVLAGGKGNRMLPKTEKINKVLIEYRSKPIIEHCLTPFINLGVKEIIILTDHLAEDVEKTVLNLKLNEDVSISFIRKQSSINGRLTELILKDNEGILTVHGNIIISEKVISNFLEYVENYRGNFLLLSSDSAGNCFPGHPFVYEEHGKKKCTLGYPGETIDKLTCCIGLNYMSSKSVALIKQKTNYSIPEDLIINQDIDFEILSTKEAVKHFEKIEDLN